MPARSEPLLWVQLLGAGVFPMEGLLLLLLLAGSDPGPVPALERLLCWGLGALAPTLLLWRRPADVWSLLLLQTPLRARRPLQQRLSRLQDNLGLRLALAVAAVISLPLLWWLDEHAAVASSLSPLAGSPRLVVLLLSALLLALMLWQWQQLLQALWLLTRSPEVVAAARPMPQAELEEQRLCLGLPLLLLDPLQLVAAPAVAPRGSAAPAAVSGPTTAAEPAPSSVPPAQTPSRDPELAPAAAPAEMPESLADPASPAPAGDDQPMAPDSPSRSVRVDAPLLLQTEPPSASALDLSASEPSAFEPSASELSASELSSSESSASEPSASDLSVETEEADLQSAEPEPPQAGDLPGADHPDVDSGQPQAATDPPELAPAQQADAAAADGAAAEGTQPQDDPGGLASSEAGAGSDASRLAEMAVQSQQVAAAATQLDSDAAAEALGAAPPSGDGVAVAVEPEQAAEQNQGGQLDQQIG